VASYLLVGLWLDDDDGPWLGDELVEQMSKVTSQLVRVPASSIYVSRKASVQVPDGTEYNSAKLAASAVYPAGPTPTYTSAVAAKVPVNGALPLVNAFVP
jgi:hypothetical protein